MPNPKFLTRYAWLSIVAALVTIVLKTGAYWLTGSVSLLSDALESLVNLVAAIVALAMLTLAASPPDDEHHFGHGKAEYFSSGLEGFMIFVAAVGIGMAAIDRLMHPQPLHSLDLGLGISIVAGVVNFTVARVLLSAGRRYQSITLEADGQHLMTDVWTSFGVLIGLTGVWLTGWQMLDPLIAILVALNIIWAGLVLIRRSLGGLLDETLPDAENSSIDRILNDYRIKGIGFHDVRTRRAGSQRFMTAHVLVPGQMSVKQGHDLLERLEMDISKVVGPINIVTHLEPLEDPASFEHVPSGEASGTGRLALAQVPNKKTRRARPVGKVHAQRAGLSKALPLWQARAGVVLLLSGSGLSMLLTDLSADLAMGAALIGFVVVVSTRSAS